MLPNSAANHVEVFVYFFKCFFSLFHRHGLSHSSLSPAPPSDAGSGRQGESSKSVRIASVLRAGHGLFGLPPFYALSPLSVHR